MSNVLNTADFQPDYVSVKLVLCYYYFHSMLNTMDFPDIDMDISLSARFVNISNLEIAYVLKLSFLNGIPAVRTTLSTIDIRLQMPTMP